MSQNHWAAFSDKHFHTEEVFEQSLTQASSNLVTPDTHSLPYDSIAPNISHVPTVDHIPNLILVRRSNRIGRPPVWLADFETHTVISNAIFELDKYICYDHLSPTYRYFLVNSTKIIKPNTYAEVVANPN